LASKLLETLYKHWRDDLMTPKSFVSHANLFRREKRKEKEAVRGGTEKVYTSNGIHIITTGYTQRMTQVSVSYFHRFSCYYLQSVSNHYTT